MRCGHRRVVERIAARIIVELIAPHERIDGQQRVRIEGVLVAGREAPTQHALSLVLSELIVAVRHLKPVPRPEQVEMQNVLGAGLPIDAVEDAAVVADVVNGQEFRRAGRSINHVVCA